MLSLKTEIVTLNFNRLMNTLIPQSNRPRYSSTVIGTLAVDGRDVTFGTARRAHCTKCYSPPINGQCTNFVLFSVAV